MRLQAAEMFARDEDSVQIARSLRVSTKSVYQWRRAWRAGGQESLASRGAGGSACRVDEGQLAELRAALEAGPAAHGWAQDQRWTLARASALAARLFGVSYTLRGMSFLLHRAWATRRRSRSPGGRAGRGRGRRVEGRDLGEGTSVAALVGVWICFEDEAGSLRPGKARTWAPRGRTPVARVSGNAGRLSVAGMACMRTGRPGRFFYRVRVHRRRKGSRASMSEADYAALVSAAHRALNAPVVLIWDNLYTHRSRRMRQFTEANSG